MSRKHAKAGEVVFVLSEIEPQAQEYPYMVVGVYASRAAAEVEEEKRRQAAHDDGKTCWPEDEDDWELEWTIDEEVIK